MDPKELERIVRVVAETDEYRNYSELAASKEIKCIYVFYRTKFYFYLLKAKIRKILEGLPKLKYAGKEKLEAIRQQIIFALPTANPDLIWKF